MVDEAHLSDTADPDQPGTANNELVNEQVNADAWARFTPEQKQRIRLMRGIAQQVARDTGDNLVMKGGTALLLAYGLPRYSTDLDFDGKHAGMDIASSIASGATAAGIIGGRVNRKKNTDTTSRHMLRYPGSEDTPLKVEVSYRQSDQINEDDVTMIDSIRVYKMEKLSQLKTAAFRDRLRARDIFDMDFITDRFPESVSDEDLVSINQKVLEVGMDYLANELREDEITRDYDADGTVLRLAEHIAALMSERNL